MYHNARLSTHSIHRHRSALDIELTGDLTELSLSPYTRIRRSVYATRPNGGHMLTNFRFRSSQGVLEAVAQVRVQSITFPATHFEMPLELSSECTLHYIKDDSVAISRHGP